MSKRHKIFVAMPFADRFWPVWKAIKAAIEAAGAEPRRVDQLAHIENIHTAIFDEIACCHALVGDFSPDGDSSRHANQNVVYEVAHANAIKKPVIIISQTPDTLAFDTRVKTAIIYTDTETGREILTDRLTDSVRAALAHSPIAVARPPSVSEFSTNSIGMKLRLIAAGKFTMGDPERSYNPPHQVTLTKDFRIGVFPVTNAQFRQFKRDHNSGEFKVFFNRHSLNGNDQPVVNVSWGEAVAFCEWLSGTEGRTYRLPTEAEWEYACRAGRSNDQSKYPWGPNWPPTGKAGNYRDATAARVLGLYWPIEGYDDGYAVTSPVGRFDPNPWGLYDMGGNVWEWCLDAYDSNFCKRDATDPLNKSGSSRVLRGASWNCYDRPDLQAAYRYVCDPTLRADNGGFRVVVC